jgi:methylaspartate ammonia-lyase
MVTIDDIIASEGLSGFYADDKAAIKAGATEDGFVYEGEPQTAGFSQVRMPGESASVQLQLDDGSIAVGDCAIAQYPGSGGRFDPIFAEDMVRLVADEVVPVLSGTEVTQFREAADRIDTLTVDGGPLHPSVRYGVSQALLDAVSKSTGRSETPSRRTSRR